MPYALVQIIFWLSLSTWFGGVLFIAIAAPIIFRTVRESDPVLPSVLSVNLDGQHGTLMAGTIVANLLSMLGRIELFCAGGVLLALIGHWIMLDPRRFWPEHLIRTALFLAGLVLVLYDRFRIAPQILKYRQQYIDNADNPEVANPAKDQFDRYHRESVTVLTLLLGALLGLILFSAGMGPSQTFVIRR